MARAEGRVNLTALKSPEKRDAEKWHGKAGTARSEEDLEKNTENTEIEGHGEKLTKTPKHSHTEGQRLLSGRGNR